MRLEEIAPGQSLTGVEPTRIVTVVAAIPIGERAVQLIYRTPDGVMKERMGRTRSCPTRSRSSLLSIIGRAVEGQVHGPQGAPLLRAQATGPGHRSRGVASPKISRSSSSTAMRSSPVFMRTAHGKLRHERDIPQSQGS